MIEEIANMGLQALGLFVIVTVAMVALLLAVGFARGFIQAVKDATTKRS